MTMCPAPASLNRRQFLTVATAATALTVTGCRSSRPTIAPAKGSAVRPRFGSQLYGWGQYYQREGKEIAAHYPEVLSALRDAGYDYAESNLNAGQPGAAAKFAELARGRGLGVDCWYTGGRLHERETARRTIADIMVAARTLTDTGARVINCNPDPIGREKSDEELLVQAAALSKLGEELAGLGLKLGVHNHTPEMKNDAREFHCNLQNSRPEFVGLCYDVHWVYRGGVPPLEVIGEYGERIVSWHLRQSRAGVWWEDLDEGDVDYGAVSLLARARKLTPLYTIELALESGTQVTRSVVENHRRSLAYARRKFAS